MLHQYWYWRAGQYTRLSTACTSQQISHMGLTIHLQALFVLKKWNTLIFYRLSSSHMKKLCCIVLTRQVIILNSVRLKNVAYMDITQISNEVYFCAAFSQNNNCWALKCNYHAVFAQKKYGSYLKKQSIAIFSNQVILDQSSVRLTNQLILKRITEKVERSPI